MGCIYMGLLDNMRIGDYLKQERQKKEHDDNDLKIAREIIKRGLPQEPICRCCKRKPEQIELYKRHNNPTLYVLERLDVDTSGYFTCMDCFTKKGKRSL